MIAAEPPPVLPRAPRGAPGLAAALGGAVLGGFAAALVLAHREGLANGAVAAGASWLGCWRSWLPVWITGFGIARLGVTVPSLGSLSALGVALLSALLALAGAIGGPVPIAADLVLVAAAGFSGFALGRVVDLVRAGRLRVGAPSMVGGALAMALLARFDLGLAESAGIVFVPSLLALCLPVGPGFAAGSSSAVARPLHAAAMLVALLGLAAWFASGIAAAVDPVAAALTVAGAAALVAAALAAGRAGVACGALALAALPAAVVGGGSVPDAEVLACRGSAEVVYRASDQELTLRLGAAVLVGVGPDRTEEPLALALAHALAHPGDRVLLVGTGSGRIEASMQAAGDVELDVVATWPELHPLRDRLSGDGPVALPSRVEAPSAPSVRPWRLSELPSGSRQLVLLGEPFGAAFEHRATAVFQASMRRIAGDGVVCQPVALDRVTVEQLTRWFDAALSSHRWNGLFAVGNGAVLVSANAQPRWRPDHEHWPDEARWALHGAHLGGPTDLDLALLGTLTHGDTGPDVRDVSQLLLRRLALPGVAVSPGIGSGSVLRRWRQQQASMLRAKAQLLALPDDAAGRAEAQEIAARTLPFGAPAAWLQAALGLPGGDGVALCEPALASRRAHAIDPTFLEARPAVFRSLPEPSAMRGALQDLAAVEVGPRLAERCAGGSPLAVALRARFPSRCARALVAALASGPLGPDASDALRELADPFVLGEAARTVVPRGRWTELLAWWRGDLPAPPVLIDVLHAGRDDRLTLARALRGRRDPSCIPLFAGLFVDPDADVRRAVALALPQELRAVADYDPEGGASSRLDAAHRLGGLHNRKP